MWFLLKKINCFCILILTTQIKNCIFNPKTKIFLIKTENFLDLKYNGPIALHLLYKKTQNFIFFSNIILESIWVKM